MHRWTLYPFSLIVLVVVGFLAGQLARAGPLAPLSTTGVEPLIASAYGLLRSAELALYALFALILSPVVIGSRRPETRQLIGDAPGPGRAWLASLWHVAVVVIGGVLLVYVSDPLGLDSIERRIALFAGLFADAGAAVLTLERATWLAALGLALAPLPWLILWRNPDSLHSLRETMLLPAVLLVDSLGLILAVSLLSETRLWAILAGVFLPTTTLWIVPWARGLRDESGSVQLGALLFLLLVTLPLVTVSAVVLLVWAGQPPGYLESLARIIERSLAGRLPAISSLLAWLAIACAGLVLLLVGIICRRTTALLEAAANARLDHIQVRLPRRPYPRVVFDPPQLGFKLIDLPLALLFTLAGQLADAALRVFGLIDRALTITIELLLRLLVFVVITAVNLIITLAIHLVYTLANLPRLLLQAVRYVLDALDSVTRFVILPLLGCLLAMAGLAVLVGTAVGYFLAGSLQLLIWGLLGGGAAILGIVICLAALANVSPGDAAYWYLLGIVEIVPYPMIVLTLALWLLILLAPRFGIQHFHAGVVTWSLTAIIVVVMAYGLLFGQREPQVDEASK